MKKHIITALLITTMISMTACGGKNTDTPAEETVATEATGELPTANDEKVVLGTVNKEETATVETTAEANTDAKADAKSEVKTDAKATATPDPKATEAPKSTQAPETTAKPKSTTKPGTQTASVTATTKPAATATPKATEAPKATAAPKATPTPTAAPVACQHTNTHVESSHDTYEVPIAGGCYEIWVSATRVCNDCGANLGESKEKSNTVHQGRVITEGVSATCTTDGRTAVEGCDCGGIGTTGGDVIPAFGHDYHDVCTDEISEDLTQVKWETVCYLCGDVAKTWWE